MLVADLEIEKFDKAAEMLKAIAHPIRISIVQMLGGDRRLRVTDIHELLNIEQAVASHHLSILKNRGIVECEREGKSSFYYLKHERLTDIISCVNNCTE